MTTNDEIIKKNADFIDYEDYDEMCRRFDVMLNEARADGYKEGHNDHKSDCLEYEKARADTTKQIFAELDKMIEELDNSLRTIGEITLDAEKYEALKKQHKVPL